MSMRLIICFVFCLAFYSCSSNGDEKFYASKSSSIMKNGADLYFSDVTVEEDLNLIDTAAAVNVSPVISDVYVKSALVFRHCTFKGKVIAGLKKGSQTYTTTFAKNVFFEDCIFNEEVNFEGTTINGNCNFLKCTFKKGGLFNRATFHSQASFTGCAFMEDAGFQQCTFMGNTFFNEAHFYRAGFFQNSYFYREFTFNLVNADGYTDFSLANFYTSSNFNYAHFKKNIVFNDASFRGKTQFVGSEFVRAEYEGSLFYSHVNFDKSTYSELLTLKNSRFLTSMPTNNGYKATKLDTDGAEVGGSKLIGF